MPCLITLLPLSAGIDIYIKFITLCSYLTFFHNMRVRFGQSTAVTIWHGFMKEGLNQWTSSLVKPKCASKTICWECKQLLCDIINRGGRRGEKHHIIHVFTLDLLSKHHHYRQWMENWLTCPHALERILVAETGLLMVLWQPEVCIWCYGWAW